MKYRIIKDANDYYYAEQKGWFFWHRIPNEDHLGWYGDRFFSQERAQEAIDDRKASIMHAKNCSKVQIIKEEEV